MQATVPMTMAMLPKMVLQMSMAPTGIAGQGMEMITMTITTMIFIIQEECVVSVPVDAGGIITIPISPTTLIMC